MQLTQSLRWLVSSRETTNLNYDLSELNKVHLAWWVSQVSDAPVHEVRGYFDELEGDQELRAHVRQATRDSAYRRVSDYRVHYGRRLAWYALTRALNPGHVVETGIDKGLGTCVLAAAVLRNGQGRVTAVDVTPDAGWLVSGQYAVVVDLVIDDAGTALRGLDAPIDLLIHDVHHTREQEEAEYEAAIPRLAPDGTVVSDNAHSFDVLPRLAGERGWRFAYFQENPVDHWYPGAGLSAAWPPRRNPPTPDGPA